MKHILILVVINLLCVSTNAQENLSKKLNDYLNKQNHMLTVYKEYLYNPSDFDFYTEYPVETNYYEVYNINDSKWEISYDDPKLGVWVCKYDTYNEEFEYFKPRKNIAIYQDFLTEYEQNEETEKQIADNESKTTVKDNENRFSFTDINKLSYSSTLEDKLIGSWKMNDGTEIQYVKKDGDSGGTFTQIQQLEMTNGLGSLMDIVSLVSHFLEYDYVSSFIDFLDLNELTVTSYTKCSIKGTWSVESESLNMKYSQEEPEYNTYDIKIGTTENASYTSNKVSAIINNLLSSSSSIKEFAQYLIPYLSSVNFQKYIGTNKNLKINNGSMSFNNADKFVTLYKK